MYESRRNEMKASIWIIITDLFSIIYLQKNMQYFFLEHGRRREHNTFETNL